MPDSSQLRIRDVLDPRRVVLDLTGGSKRDILARLADAVALTHTDIDRHALLESLLERERTSTTAIADGIAIPHGRHGLGADVICAFGRSRAGVDFESVDGGPTHLFFVLISPEDRPTLHLRWLAHLAILLRDDAFRRSLLDAPDAEAVLATIEAAEHALPAGGGAK